MKNIMKRLKVIVEKRENGYVAYPLARSSKLPPNTLNWCSRSANNPKEARFTVKLLSFPCSEKWRSRQESNL